MQRRPLALRVPDLAGQGNRRGVTHEAGDVLDVDDERVDLGRPSHLEQRIEQPVEDRAGLDVLQGQRLGPGDRAQDLEFNGHVRPNRRQALPDIVPIPP